MEPTFEEAVEVIKNLLRYGEHEGECTNADEPHPKLKSCDIHLITLADRKKEAEKFLERYENGS